MSDTWTRSMLGAGLVVLLAAGIVGCGSDETASGPRFDEIDVSEPFAAELRDLVIAQAPGDLDPQADDRISPGLFAEVEAMIAAYTDPVRREEFVDDALADWDDMVILMGGDPGERGGQELTDERIAAIRVDLENGWEDLPLDTFLQLPAIVDLAEQVSDDAGLFSSGS